MLMILCVFQNDFIHWVSISTLPVTLGFNPTRHPKMFARSPTIAVNNPIIPRETKKHGHPPHIPAGGIKAKMICKKIENNIITFLEKRIYFVKCMKNIIPIFIP